MNEERRINALDYAIYEFLDRIGRTDLAKDLLEGIIQQYYDNYYYGNNEFVKEYLEWFTQTYVDSIVKENYEELIKAGANFASSPKRVNIHALDPAIVASCLSFSDKNTNIDLIKILDKTKYGASGIGGIITKGTMYVGYPR